MKNVIINKPEPAPGILKRVDLFAIAIGMVVGSGMVTLIGPAMAYTGYSVWLAYLAAIIMGFFMVFPYIILSFFQILFYSILRGRYPFQAQ